MNGTLAEAWVKLREKRGVSQREIGRICNLSNATAWKVENGKPLRWETLHTMLQDGMGVRYGSPDYEKIHRLWMEARGHKADARPVTHAKRNPNLDVLKAVSAFRRKIAKLTPEELEMYMAKVSRIKLR
jgi:transcriptional regulator with XRE-family HTH domain